MRVEGAQKPLEMLVVGRRQPEFLRELVGCGGLEKLEAKRARNRRIDDEGVADGRKKTDRCRKILDEGCVGFQLLREGRVSSLREEVGETEIPVERAVVDAIFNARRFGL